MPPEVRDETTVILTIGEHSFRAKGFVIKDAGWTALEPKSKDKDEEGEKGKAKGKKKGDGDKDNDNAEDAQQLPPLAQRRASRKAEGRIEERQNQRAKTI